MLRGHHADDDLRGVERGVQIAGCCNRFWQDEPGQKAFVDPVSCNALGNFRFVSPEPDIMPNIMPNIVSPSTPEDNCQPGAPGAIPDDGNAAHRRDAPRVPDFSSFYFDSDFDSDSASLPASFPNFD